MQQNTIFKKTLTPALDPNHWMDEALREAEKARSLGEVPVGALVVCKNKVIARAHNEVEKHQDATAHAEVLAVRRASRLLGNWRLNETSLFVTLEPCSMCIGALLLSRVKNLFFGCYDPKQGAVGSVFDLSNIAELMHSINVYPEVRAEECQIILRDFFLQQRRGGRVAEGA